MSQCTRLTDRQTDGQTEGQTDRILIARPRLHSMSAVKQKCFSRLGLVPERRVYKQAMTQANDRVSGCEIVDVMQYNTTFCDVRQKKLHRFIFAIALSELHLLR